MKDLQDKIRGSLIAGAAGDALGYAVEFMGYNYIVQKYGAEGITRYNLDREGVAEISDDTQMTLYTANGLLNAFDEYERTGVMHWPTEHIQQAYIEWYQTQMLDCGDIKNPTCWLSNVLEMFASRAPGNTCMGALKYLKLGKHVQNDSKGCGGIMRVAPIALYGAAHGKDPKAMAQIACEAAEMTHKHPLGWLPAGMMVYTLQKILTDSISDRDRLIEAWGEAWEVVRSFKGATDEAMDELSRGSNMATSLAHSGWNDEEAIRALGEGWTGEEAWYIALYCTMKYIDNPEQAIIAAVNHSGDSDSTGAICGNLIGAIHGYDALPTHFKQNLELHDVILKMADDLYEGKISK